MWHLKSIFHVSLIILHTCVVSTNEYILETLKCLRVKTKLKNVYAQNDRGDGEKLSRWSELNAIVKLFPVCEKSGFSLVRGLKRCTFHRVHEDIHSLKREAQTAVKKPKQWTHKTGYQIILKHFPLCIVFVKYSFKPLAVFTFHF